MSRGCRFSHPVVHESGMIIIGTVPYTSGISHTILLSFICMAMIKHRRLHRRPLEAVVEVYSEDCEAIRTLEVVGGSIDPLKPGITRTVHKLVNVDYPNLTRQLLTGSDMQFRENHMGAFLIESSSCPSCAFFASTATDILGCRIRKDLLVQYRVLLANMSELKELGRAMKNRGIKYKVAGIMSHQSEELTERQREVLQTALAYDYFESGERTTLTGLANLLGIAPSSLSEILRRATKKAVSFYLDLRH